MGRKEGRGNIPLHWYGHIGPSLCRLQTMRRPPAAVSCYCCSDQSSVVLAERQGRLALLMVPFWFHDVSETWYGEWKTVSTLDRDSNLDLPVVSCLAYCESSALDHADTKAGEEKKIFRLMKRKTLPSLFSPPPPWGLSSVSAPWPSWLVPGAHILAVRVGVCRAGLDQRLGRSVAGQLAKSHTTQINFHK
uniref:Uncharacterized protein n=1 Tax=Timema bartmani TaxID=61472 RepID=A0A7R9EYE1_9NEOP|nr:unnamed protein product [Timema bartmani]